MSSEDLLVRYFTDGLLTNTLSLTDFAKIIRESTKGRISDVDIQDWYLGYQKMDDITTASVRNDVEKFLKKTRESKLRDIEKGQLTESFTLEELINNLYTVTQILDVRLVMLNKRIGSNAEELSKFNALFPSTRIHKQITSDAALDGIIQSLTEYKQMIRKLETQVSAERYD